MFLKALTFKEEDASPLVPVQLREKLLFPSFEIINSSEPDMLFEPDQSPEAEQLDAFVDVHVRVTDVSNRVLLEEVEMETVGLGLDGVPPLPGNDGVFALSLPPPPPPHETKIKEVIQILEYNFFILINIARIGFIASNFLKKDLFF